MDYVTKYQRECTFMECRTIGQLSDSDYIDIKTRWLNGVSGVLLEREYGLRIRCY